MSEVRAAVAVVTVVLCLLSGVGVASAAPKVGSPCAKVGKTVTTAKWVYTCRKKKGQGKVWVRKPRPNPTAANDGEIGSLAFAATVGEERPAPPGAVGLGPWATSMVLSEGTEGTPFSAGRSIIDQAGVPNVLSLPDGRLLAYFVSWAQGNVMAVGVRDDAGWKFYRLAVEGHVISPGGANGVDPSAVLLPDGSIRLFWMQPGSAKGASQIYSATSAPGSALGVRFVADGGARLDVGEMLYDPTAAYCGGQWFLWANASGRTVFATSGDGLNFTESQAPSGLGEAFPWSATCLPDGRVRLLASVGDDAGASFVGDLSGFVSIGESVLPSGALPDAGMARLKDGRWVLAYLERI